MGSSQNCGTQFGIYPFAYLKDADYVINAEDLIDDFSQVAVMHQLSRFTASKNDNKSRDNS